MIQRASFEECVGVLPLSYAEEGVGADDDENFCVGREFVAQAMQRVDGVVGSAVGLRAVDGGCLDAGGAFAEQLDHAQAVGEGGVGAVGLEWLDGGGGEEHAVEGEAVADGLGDGEVASMRWVEAAAEEAESHGAIVSRVSG